MFCRNCGRNLTPGEIFCAGCGTRVENGVGSNVNLNMNNNIGNNINNNVYPNQQIVNPNMQMKPKKNTWVKVVIIIFIVFVIMAVGMGFLFSTIFTTITKDSKKMICESNHGRITIMYNDNEVIGYSTKGYSYDLDEQKEYSKEIGIDAYLKEFANTFKDKSSGTCKIDGNEVDTPIQDSNTNNNDEDGIVIGNSDYGYITVPENWIKFNDIDGNDSIQYTYAGVYIVSLNYLDANGYTAENYASNYMYNKQNDSNVTGVTGATVTVGKNNEYTAYQVYMYYPKENIYLITYWFETGDGKVRYIALEGPENVNDIEIYDFLSIPESFSLNKSI